MKNLLFLTILLSLISCSGETKNTTETVTDPITNEVRQISGLAGPEQFKEQLEQNPEAVLLDIRTPDELAENGTMPNAVNFDFYAADFKEKVATLDKDVPVFLYCRSGGRSGKATDMLIEMGFAKVIDLDGGYNAWLKTYSAK